MKSFVSFLNKKFKAFYLWLTRPVERAFTRVDQLYEKPLIQKMSRYSLLCHVIWSAILVLLIELFSRHSMIKAVSFICSHPLPYLYNVLLVFATFLVVYIFKRRLFLRFLFTVIWLLLGITNGVILSSRVTPFNFTDFRLLADLFAMGNSKYVSLAQAIAIFVSLFIVALLVVAVALRGPKYDGTVHRFRNLLYVIGCVAMIPFITKAAISSDILAGYFGNLAQGYRDYGFVYSFSASVVDTGMSKPPKYSEFEIRRLLSLESKEPSTIDQNDLPNIIFVQLESFIDPDDLLFLSYSEDPTPNFHRLEKMYSTGDLTVPVVGAGTANTEFEVMTGMTLKYFGLGEYPFKTVMKEVDTESIADALEQVGYATHALHNNSGNFYGRAKILASMGFDTFTSKELMNITSYNIQGTWPTDDILVDETRKILDSTPDQADYLYTITVQSHGSYPEEKIYANPPIKVTGGATPQQNNQWEYFINQLHEVDAFIGDLIDMLSARGEKTLVVFYGDHLPTMGLTESDMRSGNLFNTNYVTWNNFGMKKKDKNLTTYQLSAYFSYHLGIREGTVFKYHQEEMKKGKTKKASYLNGLRNLQYDMLYGEQFVYGGKENFPYIDNHLVMGTEEVTADTIIPATNGDLLITGTNFTPWSRVFINDTRVPTTYLSDTRLLFNGKSARNGDRITVNQCGSKNTIFRSSNTLIPSDIESIYERSAAIVRPVQ